MKLRRALLVVSLVAGACVAGPVVAETWDEFTASVDREEEMFRQQWHMLEDRKRQIESMEPSPRRDEMRRRLAEIENRMRAQPHVLYIPPASNFTPEMDAYYARMTRRLEDCGTRNFPSRDGTRVYGKGAISIFIDSTGKLTETEILKSSGDPQVDSHMVHVAKATSPFGPVPERPTRDTFRPHTEIVVFTNFNFGRSEEPTKSIPKSEQCKWP